MVRLNLCRMPSAGSLSSNLQVMFCQHSTFGGRARAAGSRALRGPGFVRAERKSLDFRLLVSRPTAVPDTDGINYPSGHRDGAPRDRVQGTAKVRVGLGRIKSGGHSAIILHRDERLGKYRAGPRGGISALIVKDNSQRFLRSLRSVGMTGGGGCAAPVEMTGKERVWSGAASQTETRPAARVQRRSRRAGGPPAVAIGTRLPLCKSMRAR